METYRKIKIGFATALFVGFLSFMNAQQTESNTIKEVKLVKNDAFKELRSLVYANFDVADISSEAGVYKSMLKFELNKDGKISNVHAKGDCPLVDKELEQTMTGLLYKLNMGEIKDADSKIFAMPVQLVLEN